MKRTLVTALMALVTALGGSGVVIGAETGLPSSERPAAGSPWHVMHPGSFPATPEAAEEACLLAAGVSAEDALTPESCTRFGEQLAAGSCEPKMVTNGTVFDFMGFRRGGVTRVRPAVLKDIQAADEHKAMLCDLGDGVWGFWFNGENGCNNPAFVMLKPTPQMKMVCKGQDLSRGAPPNEVVYLPAFTVSCGACGETTNYPGLAYSRPVTSQLENQGRTETCAWFPTEE